MLFIVSIDAENEHILISPSVAKLVLGGMRKELSYWRYKLHRAKKRLDGNLSTKQLHTFSILQKKVNFYVLQVDEIENGIYKCEYQKKKCK